MKKNSLLRKEIEKYLQVPFIMVILLLIMNGVVYGVDVKCGVIVSIFVLLYLGAVSIVYFRRKPNIMSDLVAFSFAHGSIQNELIKELTIPYALVNLKGRILWSNQAFCDAVKSDMQHMRKHIQHIFTDITLELLQMEPEDEHYREIHIYQNERNYRVEIRGADVESLLKNELAEEVHKDDVLFAVYLYDETDLVEALAEKEKTKMVVGQIYIDNYEEAMESTEEVRQSLLIALIDRKVNQYLSHFDGLIKKMEKDKYG